MASASRGAVRLREGEHVTRPGGSVAGPVQFALADVAAYALGSLRGIGYTLNHRELPALLARDRSAGT